MTPETLLKSLKERDFNNELIHIPIDQAQADYLKSQGIKTFVVTYSIGTQKYTRFSVLTTVNRLVEICF